ncbi:MAG: restriction endonuclease subunit S [Flavobacteriales bacterium]
MNWPRVQLGEVVDLLSGHPFKSERFSSDERDIPLVKGENVSQGSILWDISKRWNAGDWNSLEKYQLRPGDVIVAMDRPWIPAGLKWAYIREGDPKALLVQRCSRLRPKGDELDATFLRYVIGGGGFESYVKPITTGVNVPHISGRQILDYTFHLPPLPTQRRIAGILSAYDELIANNQRRIAILEEMARALYREWFVHYRAPGVVMGEDGLPEGWEVKRLGEITTKIGSGATPRGGKGAYHAEGIPLIRSMNVYDDHFIMDDLAFINEEQAEALANVTVQRNDILLNITGASVARCCMAPTYLLPAHVNQHVAIIRVNDELISPHYVLDTINSAQKKKAILSIAQAGATREALTKEAIENLDIILPPKALTDRYEDIAAPMFEERELLVQQSANLRRTRDLLLPRLMSGRVELNTVEA